MHLEHLEPRRLLAAGDPVESFGPIGTRTLPITEGFDAYDMIQLSTGRLLVVGGAGDYQNGNPADVMRFKRDFTLDRTFGDNGVANTFLTRIERAFELPNGKILAQGILDLTEIPNPPPGGVVSVTPILRSYIIRLNADGSLDTSFATKGHFLQLREQDPYIQGGMAQLAIDDAGNALLHYGSVIQRLTPRGRFDPTFGDDGSLDVNSLFATPQFSIISMITRLTDGKLLLVGTGDSEGVAVARINHDGTLDASFGEEGIFTNDHGQQGYGALQLPDGNLLIAAARTAHIPSGSSDFFVAVTSVMKLSADGQQISSFGDGGYFDPPLIPAGYGSPGPEMLLQPDGKVVLAGLGPLVRMNPDGTFDESFGRIKLDLAPLARLPATLWNENTLLLAGGDDLVQLHTNGNDPGPFSLSNGTITITGTPFAEMISVGGDADVQVFTARISRFTRFFDAADVQRTSIIAGDGNDQIYPGVGNCTTDAGAGNDYIVASDFAETINGGDGDDEIYGDGGDDLISGGNGRDKLFGDDGHDTISGNAQSDTIYGGTGNDRLNGHGGRDKLIGEKHDDRLFGGASGDWLLGGDGDDQLNGEGGNDHLEAGKGIDILHGNAGDDRLITVGDDAIDLLNGDGGSDTGYADLDEDPLSIEQLL